MIGARWLYDGVSPLAPTPPGVEACSCDEAIALRAELAAARALLDRVTPATVAVDARQRAIVMAWGGGEGGHGSD